MLFVDLAHEVLEAARLQPPRAEAFLLQRMQASPPPWCWHRCNVVGATRALVPFLAPCPGQPPLPFGVGDGRPGGACALVPVGAPCAAEAFLLRQTQALHTSLALRSPAWLRGHRLRCLPSRLGGAAVPGQIAALFHPGWKVLRAFPGELPVPATGCDWQEEAAAAASFGLASPATTLLPGRRALVDPAHVELDVARSNALLGRNIPDECDMRCSLLMLTTGCYQDMDVDEYGKFRDISVPASLVRRPHGPNNVPLDHQVPYQMTDCIPGGSLRRWAWLWHWRWWSRSSS